MSPLRDTYRDERQGEAVETINNNNNNINFSINGGDGFPDFADSNLLDSIDFDDLFIGINVDGDVLPDLEMDPEILADFSAEDYNSDVNTNTSVSAEKSTDIDDNVGNSANADQDKKDSEIEVDKLSGSGSGLDSSPTGSVVPNDVSLRSNTNTKEAADKGGGGGRKSSSNSAQSKNNPQGKRKVKVCN